MLIKLIKFQKTLRFACLSILALTTGNVAFAADAFVVTEGSAPVVLNYEFRSSYDISTLAVGSTIDTVTVTSSSSLTSNCPGATATTVVAGILSGGGLAINAFVGNSLQTRVDGVGISIASSEGVAYFHPQMQGARNGRLYTTWTITFTKVSSASTGNDTLPAFAS
jgi:hypothetical protein